MANIYVGSVEWTAVTAWAALTAYVSTSNGGRGDYRRQLAGVAVGSERVFRCTTSGTSLAAEPTWVLTKNATTTEAAGPVWTECTGQEADQVSGTWKAPHARLENAFVATWGAAGDTFEIAHDHAQTAAAAVTLTSPGTAAAPCVVQCVLSTGTVPPVSADLRTTATVTVTGAFGLNVNGYAYHYGITYAVGAGASSGNSNLQLGSAGAMSAPFVNCKLILAGTNSGNTIIFGANNSSLGYYSSLLNTTMKFGATGQGLQFQGGRYIWKGTASGIDAAGSVPTSFIKAVPRPSQVLFDGVDLSTLAGTSTIVASQVTAAMITLKNCKLNAALSAVAGTPVAPGDSETLVISSDSGATNYRQEKYQYMGTQTVETTIVRTGGATNGTTPIAWKIVTTANAKWITPFESLPITLWNDSTAALTITLYGVWGGGAVPNNDDIWIEVVYLGSAATPIATIDTSNTKADYLAANAGQASDTSTWGGSTTKFKMSATITPGMRGPIQVTVKAAAVSGTFYVDPRPVIASVPVGRSFILAPGVYANERVRFARGDIESGISQ